MNKAVVLLSGGQDSTTCFHYALDRYDEIAAVSIDYGQRHRVELALAERTALQADVPWALLHVEALAELGAASLTNLAISNRADSVALRNTYAEAHGLPPSYVPGRNLLFFTLAAAWGAVRGYETLVTGVCQQDRSGYPDCRAEFVKEMREAIAVGFDLPEFEIDAPLLDLDKAQTWALADKLGVLSEIILNTHTCYEGDRSEPPKPWGYGCGECGACVERKNGYERFRERAAPSRA